MEYNEQLHKEIMKKANEIAELLKNETHPHVTVVIETDKVEMFESVWKDRTNLYKK